MGLIRTVFAFFGGKGSTLLLALSTLAFGVLCGNVWGDRIASQRWQKKLDAEIAKADDYRTRIDEAFKVRDEAIARAETLRRTSDDLTRRLRVATANRNGNPPNVDQRHLDECRGFLADAIDLAGRCEVMVQRLRADRDAVRKLTEK